MHDVLWNESWAGPMKILIVDDDALSRMVLAAALHRLGHECWQRTEDTEPGSCSKTIVPMSSSVTG